MQTELYANEVYKGYDIFVNSPEWRHGADGNFEGYVYFNRSALEGFQTAKNGEVCLLKCREWVDKRESICKLIKGEE